MNKTLYWVPRVFGILLVIFVSLFALDVFGPEFSWLALLMHMIPTLIVLIILIISWRWSRIGGILWILIGIYYVIMTGGREHFVTYLVMTLPAIVTGTLFFIGRKGDEKNLQSSSRTQMAQNQSQPPQSGGDETLRHQTPDQTNGGQPDGPTSAS